MKKKEQIKDSAKQLFFKKGIPDTSIKDITSLSKVAKGTFYIYYKDKSELVYQIAKKEQIDIMRIMLFETLQQAQKNNFSWVEQSFYNLVDFFKKNNNTLRFIYHSMLLGYLPKYTHLKDYLAQIPLLHEYILDYQKRKQITLEDAAEQLVQMYQMITFACYSSCFITTTQDLEQSIQNLRFHIRSLCK